MPVGMFGLAEQAWPAGTNGDGVVDSNGLWARRQARPVTAEINREKTDSHIDNDVITFI